MKLLHIVSSLNPIYGGQPEVVKQLLLALSDLGHQSEVLSLDAADNYFPNDKDIIIHSLGQSFGKYNLNFKLIPWLRNNAEHFDAIVCHGIWQFQSFGTWLASKLAGFPYFIYVHGALDPWFKFTYPIKHLKKWLYWPWAEYRVLKSAKAVIFTSEGEKKRAAESFWLYDTSNNVVVTAGIRLPEGDPTSLLRTFNSAYPNLEGKKLLLFMGRIHPIKGCDNLLKALAKVALSNPQLYLIMAGPDVIGWVSTLQDLARNLGIEDKISWLGMLENDLKWGAFYASSCLILPSHTENFGMVVAEALACSIPVIITNKVNIWSYIQEEKAGFVSEDSTEGLYNSIKQWNDLNQTELEKLRQNANKCFEKHFDLTNNAQGLIKIIREYLEYHL